MPNPIEALTSSDFEIKTRKPRILFFDIETAPLRIYAWKTWQTDAIKVERDWYMLSWSAKWKDGKQITKCLADYEGYDPLSEDDSQLVTELWELFENADIIVGHNLDRFDIRKTNTRAILNGLKPTSPFKTVDTLKVAKRHFAFTSNRLDSLGESLGLGRKVKTGGFELWESCMKGIPSAWAKMKRYNAKDVTLLIKVYDKLLPWIGNHPNITVITDQEYGCRNCGSKSLTKRGFSFGPTGKRQQYKCSDCGSWMSGKHIKTTDIR